MSKICLSVTTSDLHYPGVANQNELKLFWDTCAKNVCQKFVFLGKGLVGPGQESKIAKKYDTVTCLPRPMIISNSLVQMQVESVTIQVQKHFFI